MSDVAVSIEFTVYIGIFWATFYWLWVPYQGFVVFLPILLHGRAGRLRAYFDGGADSPDCSPPRPRGLLPSDFWSASGALVLLLPFAAAISLEITWLLSLVPLWAAPVVAGLFWLRLRRQGVRSAHAVAWAALTAPSFAWILYLIPRMGEFQWQSRDWAGYLMHQYVARTFAVLPADLENAALVALALLAGAVVASRVIGLREFIDLLLLATVPAFVLVTLSMPIGFVYLAWCLAVVGFWVARSDSPSRDADAVLPIERLGRSLALPKGTVVGRHDRWQTLRLSVALALTSALVLGAWSVLPPDIGIRAIGEWVSIISISAYGTARLRRSMDMREAAGVAVLSQVAAITMLVVASDVAHLVGNGFPERLSRAGSIPGRSLLETDNSIQVEPQILGAIVLAFVVSLVLSGGTRRYGALLVGAAWPMIGSLVFKANELELLERGLPVRWETSQVWGAAIGASVVLAIMWRVFGPEGVDEPASASAHRADRSAPAPVFRSRSLRQQDP